ncbi:hypothetical protein K402DRAFT_413755 [Aulographum hederae CBS 113979]|uniref:Pre-mRNA-splicing factor n=1 Tax=Aulographum hederae CBS 113979 TaxID=1176131 RepID=A0A6G1GUP0_9PEZI|nr:hypothetical protein K402DRAFT_413755 [Aulographum hederae CBS 113979]
MSMKPKKAPGTNGTKRPLAAFHDDDDEHNDAASKPQDVSHFDQSAGGAVPVNQAAKSTALVIPKLANRNWREESRRKRQRSGLPAEAQAQKNGMTDDDFRETSKPATAYGLNIMKPAEQQMDVNTPDKSDEDITPAEQPVQERTEDEIALDALLGNAPKSTLVLPPVETEDEAFRRDYDEAPEPATLEQYAAVPVEDFGAAILRGMGWKDGEAIGKRRGQQPVKARILERRPAQLGLGAKEVAAVDLEPGAWGSAAKKNKRPDRTYIPVVMKNSKTGEQLTEEELRAKVEDQKVMALELEEKKKRRSPDSDSKYKSSDRDRDRKTRREDGDRRDKDRGSKDKDRYRSSRRDRSSSVESRHRRKRDDYDRRDKDRRRDERDSRDKDRKSRYKDERVDDRKSSRRDRDRY